MPKQQKAKSRAKNPSSFVEPKLSTPRDRTKTTASRRRGSPKSPPAAPSRKVTFAERMGRAFPSLAATGDEAEL